MTGANINMNYMFNSGRIRFCALDGSRVICADHKGQGVWGCMYSPSLRELDEDSWGGWSSGGTGMNWPSLSKAAGAFELPWPDTYTCELCDRVCRCNNPSPKFRCHAHYAEDEHLCTDCHFWLTWSTRWPYFIAGAHLYEFKKGYKPENPHRSFLGFAGSIFYVRRHDGVMFGTNNLWSVRMVPSRFKAMHPDTAKKQSNPFPGQEVFSVG